MKERVEVRALWGDELLEVELVSPERAAALAKAVGPLRWEVDRSTVPSESFGPAEMDRAPLIYVGGAFAITGLLLLVAAFLPPFQSKLTLDGLALASRTVRALMVEELPVESEPPAASYEGESPVVADGDLGRAGQPDAPTVRHRREASGARDTRDDHGQRSVEVGALAALRSLRGSWESESPFSAASGGDDAIAALMGDRVGESFGFGGLSLSSTGRGAGVEGGTRPLEGLGFGGTGEGSVCGCDGMPGLARVQGFGSVQAARRVEPELRDRESRVPERIVRCGCAHLRIRGGLSRDVIRRVVRRHHAEVRHCYERGLQTRPDLDGRVLTRFTIAPSGEVVASLVESSTLQHAATEMCIAAAVRHWSFPAAESGGITNVTYPFVLESL